MAYTERSIICPLGIWPNVDSYGGYGGLQMRISFEMHLEAGAHINLFVDDGKIGMRMSEEYEIVFFAPKEIQEMRAFLKYCLEKSEEWDRG